MKHSLMSAAPPQSPSFSAVPFGIASDRRLLPSTVRLVAALLWGAKGAHYCLTLDEDLAAFCGVSIRTIHRGFEELEKAGYVRRQGLRSTRDNPYLGRWVFLLWVQDPSLLPAPPLPLFDLALYGNPSPEPEASGIRF